MIFKLFFFLWSAGKFICIRGQIHEGFYLSFFSWRSVIKLRSFLFVYGMIGFCAACVPFSAPSLPLNGNCRLPLELCSSSVEESIFLKFYDEKISIVDGNSKFRSNKPEWGSN